MTHWYELTVMVRTEEPKSNAAFSAVEDAIGRGLGGEAMMRVREIAEQEVPIPLRDVVPFEEGEADDG